MPPVTERDLARLDVLKREIVILSARLSRVINDSMHLDKALRDCEELFTHMGTGEDRQSEADRQPSLTFGSGSEEDHD